MDDLLLPSSSVEEGLQLLNQVFELLDKAGLKLNLKKCSFLKTEIEYLGHHIGSGGITPGMKKTAAVDNFKRPTSVHEVRQFLGLAGYFRKFIRGFASIAFPLTELIKKDNPWCWTDSQEKAFAELKRALVSRPILVPYHNNLETQLHTDASVRGIGGMLLQVQPDQTLKPVAYFSRVTTPAERVYHSYELETIAVVECLKRFRIYLLGRHFKLVTDCTAVRYTFAKRDLIPKIARWWLSVQEYDFEIEHRPGKLMQHVDALSRNAIEHNVNAVHLDESDWFLTLQLQDETLNQIVDRLRENSEPELARCFVFKNNRLYRKALDGPRLVVPKSARWKLLQKYHDEIGHVGYEKCLNLLRTHYWFARMARFVKKYVDACLECAYNKGEYGRSEGKLHPIPKPDVPMHTVHIDHVGPFPKSKAGNSYLLTLIDAFTKYIVVKPTRTLGSTECLRCLREIFGTFLGYPRRIISDKGTAFSSTHFKEFVTEKQIKHVITAVATPRANGQVERYHRTLLNSLRPTVRDESYWDVGLPEIVWGMNNTRNSSTRFTPYELMFAHKGNLLQNLEPVRTEASTASKRKRATENLTKVAKKMKRRYDTHRKNPKIYKKGDLVLWKGAISGTERGLRKKLGNKYCGPYRVTKLFGNDRYKIRSVKGMRGYKNFGAVVAVDALRPYHGLMGGENSDSGDSEDEIRDRQDLIDLLEG
jgi:transposase InsO family protein